MFILIQCYTMSFSFIRYSKIRVSFTFKKYRTWQSYSNLFCLTSMMIPDLIKEIIKKKKERVVYLPSTSAIVTSLQQWKYILFIIIISFTRGLNIFISLLWTSLDFFFIFSISFNVLLSETS